MCYDCDKGVYNCTVLNQVPTFRVPEEDDEDEKKKKDDKKGIANAQRADLDAGTVNLPTFTADVDEGRGRGVAALALAGGGPAGAAVECPESFTCDKEGETVLRCLCGFCSVAKDGYCVPKRQVCRVIGGRGQCVRP